MWQVPLVPFSPRNSECSVRLRWICTDGWAVSLPRELQTKGSWSRNQGYPTKDVLAQRPEDVLHNEVSEWRHENIPSWRAWPARGLSPWLWLPPGPAAHWLCKRSSVGRAASLLSLSWLGLTQHILFGLELDFYIWQMREQIVMGYLCCLWLCNELETKSQKSNRHFIVIISTLLYPITIWHIKLYELFVILLPHTKCIHLGRKDVILVTILLPIFQSRQVLVKFTRTTW